MGIMDMFQNAFGSHQQSNQPTQPAAAANTPPQPGNIPATTPNTAASSAAAAPNGTLPANADGASPLDQFKDLWQPVTTDPNAPPADSIFNVDPKKMMEAAMKTDFSKAVTPEIMAKINAGGAEAMTAMMEAMNRMSQATYGQAALASTKIVEQALLKAQESYDARIPAMVKKFQVGESLRADNPIFSNPAVSPLISAMETQFTQKYPNASAAEITALAKQYIESTFTAMQPPKLDTTPAVNPSEDWEKFFKTPTGGNFF